MQKSFIPKNRWFGWLTLCLMLIGLSSSALASDLGGPGGANVWTVYAFGNAEAVADTFRAVNNYCASSTFRSLVGLIAMLGVLSVGISGGFSGAMAKNFISYTVAVFLITYLFFGVGGSGPVVVKVDVEDFTYTPAATPGDAGTWSVGGLITGPVTVPAVVGIPASIISTVGHELTKQIEGSFGALLPSAMQLSNGAPFNLAASLIADSTTAKITDSNLASSMAYYIQDCFVTGVARGDLVATTLVQSTKFLDDIKVDYDAVMVTTLLMPNEIGKSNVVNCTDAWTYLNTAVNGTGSDAGSYLQKASAWARTPALSVVNSVADSVAQWSTNNGVTSGAAIVKQAAVLSTFTGAFKQTAAQTGNSDFITGLAVTQAYESQLTGWIVGAELFNRIMGYIFAVIQVFVYALTPLILAAALVPSLGMSLLKNYSQILVWLASWQPMLAIVNFIILSMQKPDIQNMLNAGGGQYGITMANIGIISQKSSNMQAAATFIGTMVPVFSWALVKGAMDFSSMVSSAVGEKFASGAANTMVTGNYSLNQGSMDSFTANKHSTAATGDWGYGQVSSGGVINSTHDVGGSKVIGNGGEQAKQTVTNTVTNTQMSSTGKGTQVANTGSTGSNFSDSSSFGQSGQTGASFADGSSAFKNSAITGQVGGNVVVKPTTDGKPNKGGANSAGQGAGGADGTGAPVQSGNMDKGAVDPKTGRAVNPSISANAAYSAGVGEVDTKNYNATVQGGLNAGHTVTGGTSKASLHAASATQNATKNDSAVRSQQHTVQAISGVPVSYENTAAFQGGGLLGSRFHKPDPTNAMNQIPSIPELHKAADAEENKTKKQMAEQEKEQVKLSNGAKSSARGVAPTAKKMTESMTHAANEGKEAASESPLEKVVKPAAQKLGFSKTDLEKAQALEDMKNGVHSKESSPTPPAPPKKTGALTTTMSSMIPFKANKDSSSPKVSAPATKESAAPAGAQSSQQPQQKKSDAQHPKAPTSNGGQPGGKEVAQTSPKDKKNEDERRDSVAPAPQAPQLVQQPAQQQAPAQQPQQPQTPDIKAPAATETIKVADTSNAGSSQAASNHSELAALESKVATAEQRSATLANHMQQAEQILSSASGNSAADLMPVIDKARSQVKQT